MLALPQETEKHSKEDTSLKARHSDGMGQKTEQDLRTRQLTQMILSRREEIEQKEKDLFQLLSSLKEMLQASLSSYCEVVRS